MKKRVTAMQQVRESHDDSRNSKPPRDPKEGSSNFGVSRRAESLENTKRSKSSKKEALNSNLPQVSARHKRHQTD